MKFKLIKKQVKYEGDQLAPHWIYKNFDINGDAIVAFIGGCQVKIESMVDLADVKNNDSIYSPLMLHFIMEFFDNNLTLAVHRQRLFIIHLLEKLRELVPNGVFKRDGDDIYYFDGDEKKKVTVSIATCSPVSTLIHTGINIKTEGAPVKAGGLEEMGIEPRKFAERVAESFIKELEDIHFARCKVRGVS